jgi:pimeloyl-ACP methyl ester carboxylesterase
MMQHVFATTTTTTTSAAAGAAAAVVVLGTIAVAALMANKKRKGYNTWNCSDNERIVQRDKNNIRRRIEAAATLVGPNPQWVSVVLPTVNNNNEVVDTDNNNNKNQNPNIQMLTTYYESNNSNNNSTENNNNQQQPIITAVIIHGFGCTSLEFGQFIQLLQSQTSMNIFTYDRVLFVNKDQQCQEEELLTKPRDAMTLAHELHALLQNRHDVVQQQQQPPPYRLLLIGHSYGGLIAQYYASMYADQVQGMVLIDPAHEEQFQKFPIDFTVAFTTVVPVILNLYQRIAWTGILVWLDQWSLFNFPPLFLLPRDDDDTNNNPGGGVRQACAQLYSQADGSVWKIVSAELQGCMETFDRINHHHHGVDDDDDDGYYKFRRQGNNKIPTSLVIAGNRLAIFTDAVSQESHACIFGNARHMLVTCQRLYGT